MPEVEAVGGQGGRASHPSITYKWEWDGPAVQREDGLLHYRSCRQLFDNPAAAPIVYSVGDIIFCCVEGDDAPWVAQCIDFCMDPSITENPAANEGTKEDDSGNEKAEDPPQWMPMRVSLRWMYRLSDVIEDKGRDVPGHPCEVFLSDHVTGPEVNSVNIIDGRAVLTQDQLLVPEECEMNKEGERIYLCKRFYRHSGAVKPPRGMGIRPGAIKLRIWRSLAPGELEDILRNPSDSPVLYFGNETVEKHTPSASVKSAGRSSRRSSGRLRTGDRVDYREDVEGGSRRKRRRSGIAGEATSDEDDIVGKRGTKDSSEDEDGEHDGSRRRGRLRRRSSTNASLRSRQASDLYAGNSSDEGELENDKNNSMATGEANNRKRRRSTGSILVTDGAVRDEELKRASSGKHATGGNISGRTRSGTSGNDSPTPELPPVEKIDNAFSKLTEDQRQACRRNLPWIVDSMQTRLTAAGKVVSDELLAKVVADVMRDYGRMVTGQLRSIANSETLD